MWRRRKPDLTKGALAGFAGGLLASFVMSQFQSLVEKLQNKHGQPQPAEEPATEKAAVKVSETVMDRPPEAEEKQKAGNAVHYLFGAATGGLYGALAEKNKTVRECYGTLYGSVVWLTADEIAVPALKLSKPPRAYPLSKHLSAWASHLVYGTTLELVRRGLRSV